MVQLIEDRNLFFTQKVKKLDTHFKFEITGKIFKNQITDLDYPPDPPNTL